MANILPRALPAASSVNTGAALIVDNGVDVQKATPAQIVDAARPVASEAEAQAGVENTKLMTPLRVAQAIAAQGSSALIYDSMAELMSSGRPGSADIVQVNGYSTPGDGGAALWKRASVQSSGNGKRQSADGTWWELAEKQIRPEMLGAKADGTDDTPAWVEALSYGASAGAQVVASRKTYVVSELTLGNNAYVDLNGGVLQQATGARWAVNMTGFRGFLGNGAINGNDQGLVSTTMASTASSGATTLTVSDATGIEENMLLAVKVDAADMVWRAVWVTGVSGNNITISEAIDADALSGSPVHAAWGTLRVSGSAMKPAVTNLYMTRCPLAIMVDRGASGSGTSPQFSDIQVSDSGMIGGAIFGRDINGTRFDTWQFNCGRTKTNNFTADGSETNFAIHPPFAGRYFRANDVRVFVDGVEKTLTTDYTIDTDDNEVVFNSAPSNGAAIEIRHFFDAIFGIIGHSAGGSVSGGGKVSNGIILDAYCGIYGSLHDLYSFANVTVDAGSYCGLYTNRASPWLFDGCEFTYMPFPIIHKASANGVWMSGLRTEPVPDNRELNITPNKVSVTMDGNGLYIEPFSWRTDRTSAIDPSVTANYMGVDTLTYDKPSARWGFSREIAGPLKVKRDSGPVTGTLPTYAVGWFDRSAAAGNNASVHAVSGSTGIASFRLGDADDPEMLTIQFDNNSGVGTILSNKIGVFRFDTSGNVAPTSDNARDLGSSGARWKDLYAARLLVGSGINIRTGAGSPEGLATAPVGSLYLRTDGGASTTLYVKESGTGNTGWVAK